jgi:Fe-S cluster assembly protein SufD
VYKSLFSYPLLENQTEFYYTLEQLYDFLVSDEYMALTEHHVDRNIYNHLIKCYLDNLYFLRDIDLPNFKQEQFNTFNLNKLYNMDILSTLNHETRDVFSRFDYLATTEKNALVLVDGHVYTNEAINKRTTFGVQILDYLKKTKHRHSEYIKLIENTSNFSNITFASTPYPNVIVFPHGSKDRYYKNPLHVNYENSTDDPVLESNTTIFDVQYNTHIKLKEHIKLFAGQMNYTTYIVRENSTLEIERDTNDYGGWNVFDSRFICHPGSTVKIKFKNTGSQYTQENFYFKCSSDVTVDLQGRNNISKGNEYYQFVRVRSADHHNTSNIDIKNVGNDHCKTSFIGKYEISSASEGFKGSMDNQNLLLHGSAKMQTRPILDIYTKEIECTHGCTISNVDEEQLYYLQTKGFDKYSAKNVLVDSFLC